MPSNVSVVLLNGAGSAGKSSIATALQTISDDVFLHVQMDAFLEMLPAAMLDDPDGFVFETVTDDGAPAVRISSGPIGRRTMHGLRRAIAALADAGNSLIVDDVATAPDVADYRQLLAEHHLVVVGVTAPLETLERREFMRGDRMIGLARWQHSRIHEGIEYDLVVDSAELSALECATVIEAHLQGRVS